MSNKQNVILIIMDATRPQNLGCYGYKKPTSPCIDQIASESVKFTNAFATSNCTMPSLVSMNTGLHPLQHEVIHVGLPHQNAEFINLTRMRLLTLPASLKNNGYKTAGIDWLGGYLRNDYDYYSSILQDTKVYDNAENTTNAAINFIKKNQTTPFFVFLHYWDTHDPYETGNVDTQPFQTEPEGITISEVRPRLLELKDIDVNSIKTDYDAAIRSVDTHIGRLFEYLEHEKLIDDTVVIITADHGESLGEHHIWFTHYGIYDVTLHIPLIIRLPCKQNYIDREPALHQDLFPTILNLTGIPTQEQYFYGQNIIPKLLGNPRIRKHPLIALEAAGHDCEAIRYKLWKLMSIPRQRDGEHWDKAVEPLKSPRLFDLIANPEETINKTEERPDITKDLLEELNWQIENIKEAFRKPSEVLT